MRERETLQNKCPTTNLVADRVVGCGPVMEQQRSACRLVGRDPVARVVVSRQIGEYLIRVAVELDLEPGRMSR
ncbi:hypothetical protein NDU88_008347 [Pleurodeles waltl]|uniref:Uncharacterized protein n=1 Tax=Pleurodeles waltl TaxID=8319 RepID=A0AAV7PVX7_PLEWA|nr:hypothetical protein NDU88_008347 [Pleurodeles waltl]